MNTTEPSRLRRVIRSLPLCLFVASLCLFSFLYGVMAAEYELFPYQRIQEAKAAASAVVQVIDEELDEPGVAVDQTFASVVNHAGTDDGSMILVSGGPEYFQSMGGEGGCLAWLMDRQGEIQHVWKMDPNLWADLTHIRYVPGITTFYPVGLHLLEDGGLIVTFQSTSSFPFAIGMVRVDRDSNVIWKKECHAHHWFQVTDDDQIITPTLRVLDAPVSIGNTKGRILSETNKVLEDMVAVMSLETGEILEEISMLDVMHNSGLTGLYQGARGHSDEADCESFDPLHLNWVQLIGDRVASTHDWLNPEDLLVSFRSINSIAIIDRGTHQVKWISTGATVRQHCPIFKDEHSLYVFDNLGGDESLGGTRLAEISLSSRQATTVFPGSDQPDPVHVESEFAGHLEFNRDRSAILMTVTCQSTLMEVDPVSGDLLWEYRFVDPGTGFTSGLLHTAKYCYDVSFELNQRAKVQ